MGGQAIEEIGGTKVARGSYFKLDAAQLEHLVYDVEKSHYLHEIDRARVTELDEGLILSFMSVGVKDPIHLAIEEDEKGEERILVIDGRRRVFNAIEANKRLAKRGEPTLVVQGLVTKGDDKRLEEIMVSLNTQRKDHGLMAKVEKAKRMEARGQSINDISRAFGVEPQTVGMWLKISTLSTATKKLVDNGTLAPSAAVRFAGLKPEDQAAQIEEFLATAAEQGVKPTARLAEAVTKGKREGKSPSESAPGPSTKMLRAIVGREDLSKHIDPDTLKHIKWLLGELDHTRIKGMSKVAEILEQERKEKLKAKKQRELRKAEKEAKAAENTANGSAS